MRRKSQGHIPVFSLIGFVLLALLSGCTLSGANELPAEVVGPSTDGLVTDVVPPDDVDDGGGAVLPAVTDDPSPIDFFGTQTAEAPPPVEVTEVVITEVVTEDTGVIVDETTPDITPTPTLVEESTPEVIETTVVVDTGGDQDCPATHTVAVGENLYRIALKYGITSKQLAEANGITNPDKVPAGTILKIPGCGDSSSANDIIHVVQPGENLYRIALKYGIKWQEIVAYNKLPSENVFAGQILRIPRSN